MLITFSGLDGAGKTTQIDLFLEYLEKYGYRFKRLRMYEDISVSGFLRSLFKGRKVTPKNNNSTKQPSTYRYDKNRKEFSLVLARKFSYLIDLLNFNLKIFYYCCLRKQILILDRYLYDALANLENTSSELYVKTMLCLVPKPDLAIFLDVPPQTAFSRKPEYPPDYYNERRDAYLSIFSRISTALAIPLGTMQDVQAAILRNFRLKYANRKNQGDKYSLYVDFICKTLFSDISAQSFLWPKDVDFKILLEVLRKNRMTVRWLTKMNMVMPAAYKTQAEEELKSESVRLARALEMTSHLYQEFKRRGLNFIVMKTLDNYPDLGHDVDIFSDAPVKTIDGILLGENNAKLEDPTLPERISTKRNYKVRDYAMFEIHCSKLGELGEENRLGHDLPKHSQEISINEMKLSVFEPEFRLLIVVLQRIYRHYNIRICDLYNTVQMIQGNQIDWDKLKQVSKKYGLSQGVKMYLGYVHKVALQYGLELGIRKYWNDGDWPKAVKDGNMHFRFPLVSTAFRVNTLKFLSELRWFNLNGACRLLMYAPLALAHFISVKLFKRSRVW